MADQDLFNGLSKLVGYSIVLPAFFVLIPQILKVWEAGSGEGLSIPLQAQELAMLVIGSCYNWRIDSSSAPCPLQPPVRQNCARIFSILRNFDLLCADSVGFALDLHITGPCLGYWGSYVQGAL